MNKNCATFCSTNPNPTLCMHDCRGGLRAVPISKEEDKRIKEAPRALLMVGAAAVVIVSLIVWKAK